MSTRTRFISRLIGFYCLFASLAMFAHKQAVVEIEKTLIHSPALLFLVGIITMVTGLAIVLGHNLWSGGALPVTVTLLGWLSLAKGLLFWFLPGATATAFWEGMRYEQLYYVYASISFVIGAYLIVAGSKPAARQATLPERRDLAA